LLPARLLLQIAEQQRHQIVDHVRRYVLPPPQHEEDSPASMSARFSFDDPAVDEVRHLACSAGVFSEWVSALHMGRLPKC
jgi:hypothetical protein